MRLRAKRMVVGWVIGTLASCVSHPYSARSYRNVDTSVLYATICHQGKKTIRIPADEWEDHKAHYDYRGPCRPRGVPTKTPRRAPKHTVAEYDKRKQRADWSQEEWDRHQRAQAELKSGADLEEVAGEKPPE